MREVCSCVRIVIPSLPMLVRRSLNRDEHRRAELSRSRLSFGLGSITTHEEDIKSRCLCRPAVDALDSNTQRLVSQSRATVSHSYALSRPDRFLVTGSYLH